MDAKHQFKYTYNETCIDEYSPHEITFEMPGSATLDQILYNFESYLKACGFHFDGHLEIVDETLDNIDTCDEIYGCMADWDKECGCKSTSSPLENDEWDEICKETEDKAAQKLKEWSEGLAKLEAEIKAKRDEEVKNRWFHGLCNPPSPDWKKK